MKPPVSTKQSAEKICLQKTAAKQLIRLCDILPKEKFAAQILPKVVKNKTSPTKTHPSMKQRISDGVSKNRQNRHAKNHLLLSIESWLVKRDPYNGGLLYSPYN